MFEKTVQAMFYNKAARPEDLPWHSERPARLLTDAIEQRGVPGRALDLGCGAGVFAVYLAKRGYEVTAIDFIPKALEMVQARAGTENVRVGSVLADVLDWHSATPFDLVLDSGCLHTVTNVNRYKAQLLSWTAPGSDFILAHWGRRHVFDWRPVGPRRRTRQGLVRLFAPEFRERAYDQELLTGVPLPMGPKVLGQSFWFRRAG
jgi:SAM-dependent methyltransferase